jgi:hypothetical protein
MQSLKHLLSLLIFFALSISGNYAQNYIEIGTGTVQNTMPIYSSWNYSWSSLIYKQADLGTAKSITKIGLNCTNGPKTVTNQKLYVKLTSNNVFAAANYEDPTNNGYTLVFQGDLTFVTGWNEITLTTPIAYDGVKNLIIHWENRWGTSYGPQFNSTTSIINDNKNCGNDVTFPPLSQTGYLNPYPGSLANMRFYYASSGPATPFNPIPADNATVVSIATNLTWSLGTNTSSYDLYFGTDPQNLALVVNNASATAGTYSYTPSGLLADSTMHYWKVVAKNGSQQEISPIWKFKTEVVIDQFPYYQGFEDSTIFHTYPLISAWVNEPEFSWYEYDTLQHSGLACAKTSYYNSSNQAILRSPKVLLPPNYSISYYWQNSNANKVAGHDTTYFEITTNGGQSWIKLDNLCPASSSPVYAQRTHDLTPYAGNNFFFRFRHVTDNSGSACNVFLDDIAITEAAQSAQIQLGASQVTFPELYVNGTTKKKVAISNPGSVNLVITSVTATAPFSCTYNNTILPGHTDSLTIISNATTAGSFTSNLTVHVQGNYTGNNVIALLGNVLADNAELFEQFDASTQIPQHWNKIASGTDPNNSISVMASAEAYSLPNIANMKNANDSVSPLIFITPGLTNFTDHELSFYAKKGNDPSNLNLIVGLMNDPYDANSFVAVQTVALTSQHTLFTVSFSTANTKPYVAFRHGENKKNTMVWLDDVKWAAVVPANPPAPAICTYPSNSAANVDIMMPARYVIWSGGGGSPEGYKLSIGTNNPPTNILNNANLGDTVVYQIPQMLNYSTTYYWKIVPYNVNGDATNCPVWSFTTMADPTITQYPFTQNFDALVQGSAFFYAPFLMGYTYPPGWSVVSQGNQVMSWSVIANTANQPYNAHTAPNAMSMGYNNSLAMDEWLFTAPLTLTTGYKYDLSFFYKAANSGSPTAEKMEVKVGTYRDPLNMTSGQIFNNNNISSLVYTQGSGIFIPPSAGIYYFGFHGYSDAGQYRLFVDDVTINAVPLTGINPGTNTENLVVYPNPCKGELNIQLSNIPRENTTLEILDLTGKCIHMQLLKQIETKLMLPSIKPGLYLLKVSSDGIIHCQRFVVE